MFSGHSRLFSGFPVLLFSLLLFTGQAMVLAAEKKSSKTRIKTLELKEIGRALEKIKINAGKSRITLNQIKSGLKQLAEFETLLNEREKALTEKLKSLQTQLDALEKPPETIKKEPVDKKATGKPAPVPKTSPRDTSPEFKKKVRELKEKIKAVKQDLSRVKAFQQTLKETHGRLLGLQKRLFTENLLVRQDNSFSLLARIGKLWKEWVRTYKKRPKKKGRKRTVKRGVAALIVVLMLLGLVLGYLFRKLMTRLIHCDFDRSARSIRARRLACSYTRLLPWYFGIGAGLLGLVLFDAVAQWKISYRFLSLALAYMLVAPLFLSVLRQSAVLVSEDKVLQQRTAVRLNRRMIAIMLTFFISFMVYVFIKTTGMGDEALMLLRDAAVTLLVLFTSGLVLALTPDKQSAKQQIFKYLSITYLYVILLLELGGYRNLSFFLYKILFGTGMLLGVFWMLNNIINDFTRAMKAADSNWHQAYMKVFRTHKKLAESSLFWLRMVLKILLWVGLLVSLLYLYGFYETVGPYLKNMFFIGVPVGSIKIVPYTLLIAFLSFAAIQTLTGWIKKRMSSRWLKDRAMDRGAKDAIVTLTGYTGITIAFLVALGILGVSFTNLAIIAGALSVGIGFGLQAIVNNFVSGLILLFERPIRPGDWIVVGDVEGYVKKISIRATIIETFDRADVVVPNSELISSKVTNWMYHNMRGRLRLPVGVAYGSDTGKVIDILYNAAVNHDEVIKDEDTYPVRVLFMRFGDSALEFELRCFISNIDHRLRVISTLNLAINEALAEAGISIPFPQRDIHIKDMPENLAGQKPATRKSSAKKKTTRKKASDAEKDSPPSEPGSDGQPE